MDVELHFYWTEDLSPDKRVKVFSVLSEMGNEAAPMNLLPSLKRMKTDSDNEDREDEDSNSESSFVIVQPRFSPMVRGMGWGIAAVLALLLFISPTMQSPNLIKKMLIQEANDEMVMADLDSENVVNSFSMNLFEEGFIEELL